VGKDKGIVMESVRERNGGKRREEDGGRGGNAQERVRRGRRRDGVWWKDGEGRGRRGRKGAEKGEREGGLGGTAGGEGGGWWGERVKKEGAGEKRIRREGREKRSYEV